MSPFLAHIEARARRVHVSDMPRLNLIYRRVYTLMGLREGEVCVMTGSYGVPAGSWSLTRPPAKSSACTR